MKLICIMILPAVLALISPAAAFADTEPVGIIKSVTEDTAIIRDGKTHRATPGMKVLKGDLIKKERNSVNISVVGHTDTAGDKNYNFGV